MKNILALDLSTKSSGWAVRCGENEIHSGVITSTSAEVEKRILIMRDAIVELLKKYNIDTIVIEDVRPDGYNNHTARVLMWLQGIIHIGVYEYNKNIKIELIGASSWRSKIGIQGYRITREIQKQKDIEYANQKFGLSLTPTQDDEADALCILASFMATGPESKQKLNPIGSEESAF